MAAPHLHYVTDVPFDPHDDRPLSRTRNPLGDEHDVFASAFAPGAGIVRDGPAHVGQAFGDRELDEILTYPRAEVRYLPQSLISDVPKIVAGLQVGQSFSTIPVPNPPVRIRPRRDRDGPSRINGAGLRSPPKPGYPAQGAR